MEENTSISWLEALKITAIVLGVIIGFWVFFFGIVFAFTHANEIKLFMIWVIEQARKIL